MREKCKNCYNKIHRPDICVVCKWLFIEIPDAKLLEDEYKPMINNIMEQL